MKINSQLIKNTFAIATSILMFFAVSPAVIFAANYGGGIYGADNYGFGDVTAPAGGSITYTNGYQITTTVSLTVNDGTDTDSGIDTTSRIVQRESATLTNGTCGSYGGYGTIATTGTYPNFTDAAVVPVATGNCYQYQYLVSDLAGNQATYTSASVVKIDTVAPAFSSKTTFSGWYTSNQTSTFTYTDSVSGITSGTPVTCSITTEGSAQTCSVTPNVCDAAGNCNTTPVTSNGANIDKTAPATGSISYTDGYFTSASVPLVVNDGTDSGSGINTSSRAFQRRSASLILGICGVYGSYSSVSPTPTIAYPNFTDTTVTSGNCYQYEYQISDTAGNQATYTSGNAARIDTSTPGTPGTPGTTTPTTSTSQNWTWIAATDAVSDVVNYAWRVVTNLGAAVASGTTSTASVTTNLTQGVYNFFVKALSGAGTYGSESQGTVTVNATPTPTPTASPSNTNSGSSSSSSSSSTSAPSCSNSVTTGVPDLFEIHTTKNTATLYFAPPTMPYSNFYIAYSTKSDSWQYGTQYDQGYSSGVLRYTVNVLQPNTTYYFKIRPGNGCAPGNWGNTMMGTTTSSTQTKTYYKNVITAVVQSTKYFFNNLFPSKSVNTPQPTSTVKPTETQNPIQKPTQTAAPTPKSKFCILWWCF